MHEENNSQNQLQPTGIVHAQFLRANHAKHRVILAVEICAYVNRCLLSLVPSQQYRWAICCLVPGCGKIVECHRLGCCLSWTWTNCRMIAPGIYFASQFSSLVFIFALGIQPSHEEWVPKSIWFLPSVSLALDILLIAVELCIIYQYQILFKCHQYK